MPNFRTLIFPAAIGLCLALAATAYGAGGCSTAECHQGIADIRESDSEMLRTIKLNGSCDIP